MGNEFPAVIAGSTAASSNALTDASCGDGGIDAPDITYQWTAPADGVYTVSTLGSGFDTLLSVRDAECGGAELACNDDADDTAQSLVTLTLTAGQTVVILVDGYGGDRGDVQLSITPLGDCCTDNPGPQCTNTACAACVCAGDAFCCEARWDGICAGEAIDPCGAECGCPTLTPTPTPTVTRTPRRITILSPANGSVVHTRTISVTGEAAGTGAITVNGVAATVSGDSFSAIVDLIEGVNAITATDSAGGGSDTISVTLDTAPVLHLITIAIETEGLATITGRAGTVTPSGSVTISNTSTGMSTTVTADESGGFTGTIAAEPGDILSIVVVDGGNVSPTRTLEVSALSAAITAPAAGETIAADRIVVRGTYQGGAEVGVMVNGLPAANEDGAFLVPNVPLTVGENVLTATATNRRGDRASQRLTVASLATPSGLTLSASPNRGVVPLPVIFSYEFNGTAQSVRIDFDGDGVDDLTVDPTRPLRHTYHSAGIYLVRLRVTDEHGASAQAVVTIHVAAPEGMDGFFQSQWNSMLAALIAGDKETALTYLTPGAQEKYAPVFDALLPHMPEIVASFSPLQRVSLLPDIGEYGINRTIDGRNRVFLIYFLRDTDGVWRIDAM